MYKTGAPCWVGSVLYINSGSSLLIMTDHLNHILYLQETVKLECKELIDEQTKTEDPKKLAEYQALLNSLFVQSIDLNTKAIVAMQGKVELPAEDEGFTVESCGVESVDEILKSLNCITRIENASDE
jgi:hypothetical protein